MKRIALVVCLGLVGWWSIGVAAVQQGTPAQPLTIRKIEKLKDNLYFISGGDLTDRATWTGGNAMVLVRDQGVVLVDTMLPGAGRGILAQIKSVTDKPVTTIINTHTHFDHTGSNTDFPATVEFIAHENTRANLARATCEPVTNCGAFKGDNAKAREINDRLLGLHRHLFCEANPIPVKWAAQQMGLIRDGIRLPLTPLAANYQDLVRDAMRQVMADPQVTSVFEKAGSPPAYQDQPEFAKFVEADAKRLIPVIAKIGRLDEK